MPEEPEKKEERDDADAGTLLKTVIDRLDSISKRMDAMEEKEEPEPVAADKRKRKDAEEKEEEEEKEERKDAKEDDSTVFYRGNKAPKRDAKKDDDDSRKKDDDDDARHKKDARRREDDDDDSKKRDDDDDSRKKDDARRMKKSDDDDDDSKKKDDAHARHKDDDDDDRRDDDDDDRRKADSSSISKRIAAVERMMPKQLNDSDRAAFSDVQARADDIYHAFGKSAPAPMQGETLMAYRQRLVTKLKDHSPTWKKTNIYAIADDEAFAAIESSVYADALTVAHSPATAEPGTLRMVTSMQGGHEIHTFVGEPRAWMDSMAGPVRMHVTSINTPDRSAR